MPNNHTRLQPPTKQTIQTVGLTQWTNRSFIPSRIIFLSEDAHSACQGLYVHVISLLFFIYLCECVFALHATAEETSFRDNLLGAH